MICPSLKSVVILWEIESYAHAQDSAHAQESPEQAVISDHWWALKLCESKSNQLRQSYQFSWLQS